MFHMSTSALFITFSNHHASGNPDSLLFQTFQSQNCWISRISIICPTSPIQSPIYNLWIGCSNALKPPWKWWLFVIMSIKKQSWWYLALNLRVDDWRISWIFNNFRSHAVDFQLSDPVSDMVGSLIQFAISFPLTIKWPWKVVYLDVLDQRGYGWSLIKLIDALL